MAAKTKIKQTNKKRGDAEAHCCLISCEIGIKCSDFLLFNIKIMTEEHFCPEYLSLIQNTAILFDSPKILIC